MSSYMAILTNGHGKEKLLESDDLARLGIKCLQKAGHDVSLEDLNDERRPAGRPALTDGGDDGTP